MWVESEVSNGSKFYFTLTSQISPLSMDAALAKMQPFHGRTILFVDTLYDRTDVVQRIIDLGLKPYVVHDVSEVSEKTSCPHIDTIVVDSLSVVSGSWTNSPDQSAHQVGQTESLREYEHLRYIPMVLLSPVSAVVDVSYVLDSGLTLFPAKYASLEL